MFLNFVIELCDVHYFLTSYSANEHQTVNYWSSYWFMKYRNILNEYRFKLGEHQILAIKYQTARDVIMAVVTFYWHEA